MLYMSYFAPIGDLTADSPSTTMGLIMISQYQCKVACVSCLFIVAVSGCSKSQMQFHFAAANLADEKPHLTFYRVTVKGESGASTSKLLTGYYDAEALRSLFGKVKDPEAPGSGVKVGSDTHRTGNIVVEFDPISKRWRVVEDNEKFTVFWGTNADAMAQQVGAFAESNQTGDDIASILAAAAGRDKFDALRDAQRSAEEKESSRAKYSGTLKSLQGELEALKDKKADGSALAGADLDRYVKSVESIVRRAAQAGLIQAGSGTVLSDNTKDAMEQVRLAIEALKSAPKAGK